MFMIIVRYNWLKIFLAYLLLAFVVFYSLTFNLYAVNTCYHYETSGDYNMIDSTVSCNYNSLDKTGYYKFKIDSMADNSVLYLNFELIDNFKYDLIEVKDNQYAFGSLQKTVNIYFDDLSNGNITEMLILDNIQLAASNNKYVVNIDFMGSNYNIDTFNVKSTSGKIRFVNTIFTSKNVKLEAKTLSDTYLESDKSNLSFGVLGVKSNIIRYKLNISNQSTVTFINTLFTDSEINVDNSIIYFKDTEYKEAMDGNVENKLFIKNGSYFYYQNTDNYIAASDNIIYTTAIYVSSSTFVFDGVSSIFGVSVNKSNTGFVSFENSTLEFANVQNNSNGNGGVVVFNDLLVSSTYNQNILEVNNSKVYIKFEDNLDTIDFAFKSVELINSTATLEYNAKDVNINNVSLNNSNFNFIINEAASFNGDSLNILGASSLHISNSNTTDEYFNFKNVNINEVNNGYTLDLSDVIVSDVLKVENSDVVLIYNNNDVSKSINEVNIIDSDVDFQFTRSDLSFNFYKFNALNSDIIISADSTKLMDNGIMKLDNTNLVLNVGNGSSSSGFVALNNSLININNSSEVVINTKFNSQGTVSVDNSTVNMNGSEFFVKNLNISNGGSLYINNKNDTKIDIKKLELSSSGSIDFASDANLGSSSSIINNGGAFYIRDHNISLDTYVGNSNNFRSLKVNTYVGIFFEYDKSSGEFGNLNLTGNMDVSNDVIVVDNKNSENFSYLDEEYLLSTSSNGTITTSDNTQVVNLNSLYYNAKISDNSTENQLIISYECNILNTSEECKDNGEEKGEYGVDSLKDGKICNNADNYIQFMKYVDSEYVSGNFDEKLTNDLAYAIATNDSNTMNNMLAVQNTSKIKGMQGIVKSFNDMLFNRNARYLSYNQEYQDSYYYGYETENNTSFWYGFNYVNKNNRYECGSNEQITKAYSNMVGFDYVMELENDATMIYGASLGYSFGNSSGGEFRDVSTLNMVNEMSMDMSVLDFAFYTGYINGNNSLFFDLNGILFNNSLTRNINVPNIYNVAESKSNDFVLSLNIQDTYKIELEDSIFNLEPYTRLMYNSYFLDTYTEEGSNSSFVVQGENYNELFFSLGSYVNFNLEEYEYEYIKPYLNFNLSYNLLNDNLTTTANFVYNNNQNSSGFTIKDATLRRLNMEAGLGLTYVIEENMHLNFAYNLSYDFDKAYNHQLFIKYSYKF